MGKGNCLGLSFVYIKYEKKLLWFRFVEFLCEFKKSEVNKYLKVFKYLLN